MISTTGAIRSFGQQINGSGGSGGGGGTASALASATTTVNVSSAPAPSTAQVLTASDSTHAVWQTATLYVQTYGAVGNGKHLTTCTTTSASATMTCTGSSFQTSDVGAYIAVLNAGSAGATLITTISARASTTSITLGTNALNSISGTADVTYGHDDTTNFQSAINASASTGMEIIAGNTGAAYIIGPLTIPSGTRIKFEDGSTVRVKSGMTTNQVLFDLTASSNILFDGEGASIYAPFAEYLDEFNHIFNLKDSHWVTISGFYINGAGGDGVYIADNGTTTYSSDVLVNHMWIDHADRNGISVISARNVTLSNIRVTNMGPDPSAGGYLNPGIDIEPNNGSNSIQGLNMDHIYSTGNRGAAINFTLSNLTSSTLPVTINVKNVWSDSDGTGSMSTQCEPASAFKGAINIDNINSYHASSFGFAVNNYSISCPMLTIRNPTVIDPNVVHATQEAFSSFSGGGNTVLYGNIDIQDATIIDTRGGSAKINWYYEVSDFSNIGITNWRFKAKFLSGALNGTATEGSTASLEEPFLQTGATPVFDASIGDPNPFFHYTFNANVTSSTLINTHPGQRLIFEICPNASHTFSAPTNLLGLTTPTFTSGKCWVQQFIVSVDGVTARAVAAGVLN